MSSTTEAVSVRVLDREYTVGVAPDQRESLAAAARLLDGRMREVRGGNRMAAVDRVAVLAALNLAHELQQLREENEHRDREMARMLEDLQRKLDALIDARCSRGRAPASAASGFTLVNRRPAPPTNGLGSAPGPAILPPRPLPCPTACATFALSLKTTSGMQRSPGEQVR